MLVMLVQQSNLHNCMQVTAVYWITHNVAQKLCGFTEEDNEDAPVRGATFIHAFSHESW
jgi:hypothetical protein